MLNFLPLFAQLRRPMLMTLVLSVVTLAAGIALLGLSGWFLTAAALSTAGAAFNLFGPSAGVRGLSFVRILSRYGEKLSGHDATLRLLSRLRGWLFARLFPLVPLDGRFGRGDLVSRLLADVEALDTMFLVALGPISTAVLAGIGMTTLLVFVMPDASLVYGVSFFTAALVVPVVLIASSRKDAEAAALAASALRASVLDGIEGHQDLVLFGETARSATAISATAARLGNWRKALGRKGASASAIVNTLMGVALVATLIAGIAAVRAGTIDGPLLTGLLLAVIASFEASAMLVRSSVRLAGAAAAARRLDDVARALPTVAEPAGPVLLPPDAAIRFEAVRFGYDARRPIFTQLDLSVRAGEHIVIRGPSGCGKSTLAQLLLRLAEPQAGTIRFGGIDIRAAAGADLHRRVALMTQDAPVFLDTVRANLLIAAPDATDAQLWSCLEAARLGAFVRSLTLGLDAPLGEAGRTLSAGQARRLCLARTLLTGADVLVFDEPTSGLDRETEAAFLADLPGLVAGRTAIVITHATVPPGFDRVLELRAGQLQEMPR